MFLQMAASRVRGYLGATRYWQMPRWKRYECGDTNSVQKRPLKSLKLISRTPINKPSPRRVLVSSLLECGEGLRFLSRFTQSPANTVDTVRVKPLPNQSTETTK